jgi:CheY-like chemotaxis protein
MAIAAALAYFKPKVATLRDMTTILVAEDDEPSRTLIARRLTGAGYDVITATDGADAVAKCLNFRPDILLMDLSMPELDGVDAWRTLLEMMETPPPVVAVTGARIRDVQITCSELGFAAYIQKPYAFDELLKVIADLRTITQAA